MCTQGKVAAAAVVALASVVSELPSAARKARVLPAMRRFWLPKSGNPAPEVQLVLGEKLSALLDGLQGCMDAEEDVLSAAACFKCASLVPAKPRSNAHNCLFNPHRDYAPLFYFARNERQDEDVALSQWHGSWPHPAPDVAP